MFFMVARAPAVDQREGSRWFQVCRDAVKKTDNWAEKCDGEYDNESIGGRAGTMNHTNPSTILGLPVAGCHPNSGSMLIGGAAGAGWSGWQQCCCRHDTVQHPAARLAVGSSSRVWWQQRSSMKPQAKSRQLNRRQMLQGWRTPAGRPHAATTCACSNQRLQTPSCMQAACCLNMPLRRSSPSPKAPLAFLTYIYARCMGADCTTTTAPPLQPTELCQNQNFATPR